MANENTMENRVLSNGEAEVLMDVARHIESDDSAYDKQMSIDEEALEKWAKSMDNPQEPEKPAKKVLTAEDKEALEYMRKEADKDLPLVLADEMSRKAARGEAVWQAPKDERPIMHMPVNPRTGNYFQNGKALVLMQAQYEMKTADNRWISARALNVLRKKEGKDIIPKKGEHAIIIPSGDKDNPRSVAYFNYSQLHGKDLPKSIEIIDKTKDSLGEKMLNYMRFKANDAKEKAEVTKENFWELGRKANYDAICYSAKLQTELDKSMSVFKDAMPEFENRLAAIKGFDRKAEPKNEEDRFMRSMANSLEFEPDKKNYVIKAAASALINQVPEKTVIKMIDKFAPEAAKDAVKMEQGKGKYSKFVMDTLGKDKVLQAKIAEGKNKSAAR
ncbi:MAG: hypothetical protein J6N51_13385 [Selenomonas sp.]|nr:hypothetical protein [Selenomonas sp.]